MRPVSVYGFHCRTKTRYIMNIDIVDTDKKRYLSLLLLADEQESMIDRYLEQGEMFAASENGTVVAVCVVTREGEGVYELKNLAVRPDFQRRGIGRAMIGHVWRHYAPSCRTLLVGTGDSPSTVPFYERCGFVYSHRVKDFFTDNYDHPIIDGGVLLTDMLYFKRER